MTIDIDDLNRNDVEGALHYWIQELRAGRSCFETTNMLLHLQDDPEELMDGIAKASVAVGAVPNAAPRDDSALVDALSGYEPQRTIRQRSSRVAAAIAVAKRRVPTNDR